MSEPLRIAFFGTPHLAVWVLEELERAGIVPAVCVTPPDKPVGLVFIALASAAGSEARRFLFGEHLTRAEIRDRSAKTAMNMLRIRLLDDDTPPSI